MAVSVAQIRLVQVHVAQVRASKIRVGQVQGFGLARRSIELFDLSGYGRPDYKTPVLDNLAKQGLKFTDAYAAAPVCTPTRTAFITGRYPQRLPIGLEEPISDANMQVGNQPEHQK